MSIPVKNTSTQLPKPNTSFKSDVLRLASGTGIAQIIGVLSIPILSRLYAPEAFGIMALFLSLTTILGVLACMRYELSIVLPENDSEAANLLGVSLLFTLIITFCTVLIIWFGSTFNLGWINMSELAPYLWLIPIGVLFQGLFTAFNYWNTRTKHFTRISIANVSKQIANTTGMLSAGFAGYATGGVMIVASVGSQVIATIVLGGQILRDNSKFFLKSIDWRKMMASMKRYRKFPIYSSWSALLNIISWQLPVLMLGVFFSPIIVGYYALGFRVIQMPMQLVGQAVSQVFIQRVAQAKKDGSLSIIVERIFRRLLIISFFPLLMLTLLGDNLFLFIFGVKWAEAGVFIQILSPWAIVWFISSPLGNLPNLIEKQEFNLKINICLLLTRVFSMIIGGYFQSPRIALFLFSLTGIIVYSFMIYKILLFAGVSRKNNLIFLIKEFGKNSIYIIPVIFLLLFFQDLVILIFCSSALILLIYYLNNINRLLKV